MNMLNNHITLPTIAKLSCSGALKKYIYINHICINQLIQKNLVETKKKNAAKR
jgi:hypothetical protein